MLKFYYLAVASLLQMLLTRELMQNLKTSNAHLFEMEMMQRLLIAFWYLNKMEEKREVLRFHTGIYKKPF